VILALVDDLMVGVRIEEAAKAIGSQAEVVSTIDEAKRRLQSQVVEGLVVDLAIPGLDLKDLASNTSDAALWLVGFYPHVEVERRRAAEEVGIEYVYPRSRFLRDLPKLLLERLEKKI
jgi:hypothetical protein